jgi:beta-mannosidase
MPPDHLMGTQLRARKLLAVRVPAPIHQVLQEAGIIDDPNYGLNSLRARWVEEQYWIYRHTFEAPEAATRVAPWLVFEQVEMVATVWLNGEELGEHANVHRPARFEVTGRLRPGENLLVVRLTTGLAEACDKPVRDYMPDQISLLTKRQWHRKPQYQSGWDWNPRLMNVGILGDVRLEWSAGPRLAQATVLALPSEDLSAATVYARATVENPGEEAAEGVLRARVVETGEEAWAAVSLPAGESRQEVRGAFCCGYLGAPRDCRQCRPRPDDHGGGPRTPPVSPSRQQLRRPR